MDVYEYVFINLYVYANMYIENSFIAEKSMVMRGVSITFSLVSCQQVGSWRGEFSMRAMIAGFT